MRAGHLAQTVDLLGGLDALGDDADPEIVGEPEDGLDDGSRVRAVAQRLTKERSILSSS